MGTKLAWIRDCWSLFVTNLAPATTTKDLFDVFKEAGPVFDVFFPKDRSSGGGRGFVRFKTERDANTAIQRMNGRIVCRRKIGVQIVKVINRDIKYLRTSEARRGFTSVSVNQLHGRDSSIQHRGIKVVEKRGNEQVWIEERRGLMVVKIADSLASSLKQAVCGYCV